MNHLGSVTRCHLLTGIDFSHTVTFLCIYTILTRTVFLNYSISTRTSICPPHRQFMKLDENFWIF